jgi:hypothetical protein
MVSVFLFTHSFFFTFLTWTSWLRARNAVPETPSATPVSITQSLSSLRLEHVHLLEEHGADRATLRQREAELADVQAREVDAQPPTPSSKSLVLRKIVLLGLSAQQHLPNGNSDS